jgi:hypothetical protein
VLTSSSSSSLISILPSISPSITYQWTRGYELYLAWRSSITAKKGCFVSQAVSRRPHIADIQAQSQTSAYGICGGKSGTEIGFALLVPFIQRSIFMFYSPDRDVI